ncbi:MAG: hypothetical protein M1823_001053 [Watsoniomyces obsoletus]|nr:MAG: hypothetical protein M1823_001053 [Watsoniomyces obsoletus]
MTPHERPPDEPRLPTTQTSHPSNPIPEEPSSNVELHVSPHSLHNFSSSSQQSLTFSTSPSDSDSPSTPPTDPEVEGAIDKLRHAQTVGISFDVPDNESIPATVAMHDRESIGQPGDRSSFDISFDVPDNESVPAKVAMHDSESIGQPGDRSTFGTALVAAKCCGGGCCFLQSFDPAPSDDPNTTLTLPDNEAFRNLDLKLGGLNLQTELTSIVDVPEQTVFIGPIDGSQYEAPAPGSSHPPSFVTPHPGHAVYSARIHHARELTKPGAEKRTYHVELDVTDYPQEESNVDFVVGGAVGVCVQNPASVVDDLFMRLGILPKARDQPIELRTTGGRWPTIWGEEEARSLITTRRELLTWCSDMGSQPPTKQLLRLLAEYATEEHEKKILLYLCSAQGQAAFCDLRTGPHITVTQLLHAFASSQPPLDHLVSVLNPLMPRFYSLSNDPHSSCMADGETNRRLIEIAVTVHETKDWRDGVRTGVGSGFLERSAKSVIEAEQSGQPMSDINVRIPMFRGLMANPLAQKFASDGPMLLIGAGVGIAPFRGFVQRRLKSANCANKVWVLQGVRDSLLDEIYHGEWGVHEDRVKRVVQSRRGQGKYVQEEVRNQADLVWFIVNSIDGRIFVCGSSKGMGEGVENALVDVAMEKGRLNHDEALEFWKQKKDGGQYISETW